jgi:hypothetical protein
LRPQWQIRSRKKLREDRRKRIQVYLQDMTSDWIWEYTLPRDKVAAFEAAQAPQEEPRHSFKLQNGYLLKVPNEKPRRGNRMKRLIVAAQKNKDPSLSQKIQVGNHEGILKPATLVEWKDGTPLFEVSTEKLRNFRRTPQGFHKSIQKWSRQVEWAPNKRMWKQVWIAGRAAKESCFLWQVLYQIPATNKWRFPTAPAYDTRTHCKRCQRGFREDLMHCLWICPRLKRIWRW